MLEEVEKRLILVVSDGEHKGSSAEIIGKGLVLSV